MQARAPLMKEHRLIERMLTTIEDSLAEVEAGKQLDSLFVDTVVDFVRTYADRTHHGKEEDILFAELSTRQLSAADQRAMDELVAEHVFARRTTAELAAANERFRNGDVAAPAVIVARLHTLCDFYPVHIAKEDGAFFLAARAYFTDAEDQAMLARFWEFDRGMIHEKYAAVVGGLSKR